MPSSDYWSRGSSLGGAYGKGSAVAASRASPSAPQDATLFNGYGRHLNLQAGASFGVGSDHLCKGMLIAVLDGVVKGYIGTASGQRLIVGFRFAGDLLLIPEGEQHLFLVVEALTQSKLLRLGEGELSRLRQEHPQVDQRLWAASYREHSRIIQHMLRLGCMGAQARIASFLLEMRGRLTDPGGNRASLWLPMTRQDIAEYLGMKPETVSRNFGRLRAAGIIDTPAPKHVIVKNRERLLALAGLRDGAGGDDPV